MRAIVWKEWRENRWKYLTLWLVFNLPILMLGLMLAINRQSRTPFADLGNQTFMKYLPLPLFEGAAVVSVFLFATGFLGVATFLPEVDEQSLFFVFQHPVQRWHYALMKLANGSAHVALAAVTASLIAPAAVYGMILLSGKVTTAASGAAFGAVMAAALRAGLWCALVSTAAFAGCALIGSVVPRWWLATGCGIVFILLFAKQVLNDNRFFNGGNFFDMFSDVKEGSLNVSASFGTSNWLTVSGPCRLQRPLRIGTHFRQ